MTYSNLTTAPPEFVLDCLQFGGFDPDDVLPDVVAALVASRADFTAAEIVDELRSEPEFRPHVEAIDAGFRAEAASVVCAAEALLRDR
jgi:hypothetical protein